MVVYCVVPAALEAELVALLVKHYSSNPEVAVVLDRRCRYDPRHLALGVEVKRRQRRDRRRARILGSFPKLEGLPSG
jgi:hypothetical protein